MRAKWQARLCSTTLTEAQFTEVMAEAIHEKLGRKAQILAPLELRLPKDSSGELTIFLSNDWAVIATADAMRRTEHVRRRLLGIGETLQTLAPELAIPEVSDVVPVIKDDRFIADVQRQTAGLLPFVHQPLVADLHIFYVIDLEHTMNFVSPRELEKWNVTLESLHTTALKNLRRKLPQVQRHGDGPAGMLVAGGDYEASLLLLPEVWKKIAPTMKGDLLACVPGRDMMLFTGADEIGGREMLTNIARQTLAGGDHLISGTILRLSNEKWIGDSSVETPSTKAKPWWRVW